MIREYIAIFSIILLVAVGFGLPAYLIILAYRKYRSKMEEKFQTILRRAERLSNGPEANSAILYGVYGFLNITCEYRLTVRFSRENADELTEISKELQAVSVRHCLFFLHFIGAALAVFNNRKFRGIVERQTRHY